MHVAPGSKRELAIDKKPRRNLFVVELMEFRRRALLGGVRRVETKL